MTSHFISQNPEEGKTGMYLLLLRQKRKLSNQKTVFNNEEGYKVIIKACKYKEPSQCELVDLWGPVFHAHVCTCLIWLWST